MTPLPLPPPPPPLGPPASSQPPLRPGQLTPAWRVVFCLGWIGVVLAFAAVWKSGRTLGLAPWWLGPSADPHNIAVNLIPFVPALVAVVCALRNVRRLPYVGIVAALAVAGVAAGDAGRFNGIAVVELAAAAAGMLVSIASFAGLLMSAQPAPADPQEGSFEAGRSTGLAEPGPTEPGSYEPVAFRSSTTQ